MAVASPETLRALELSIGSLAQSEFRGQTRVVVPRESLSDAFTTLRDKRGFDLLVDDVHLHLALVDLRENFRAEGEEAGERRARIRVFSVSIQLQKRTGHHDRKRPRSGVRHAGRASGW